MQPEPGGVRALFVRQVDLGEDFLPALPHGAQALERRTVREADAGQALVPALHRHRIGALRRPHGQVLGGLGPTGGQDAGRVEGPGLLRAGVVLAGVDGEGTAAAVISGVDRDLHLEPAPGRQPHRRLKRQLLQHITSRLITGPDTQLHHSRRRHDHLTEHRVIGQPRMRVQRQPPGEQETLRVGQRHRGAQQRMPRRTQTETDSRSLGGRDGRGGGEPVVPVLEGVRGQVDAVRARALEEGVPVGADAADVQPGQSGGERRRFGTVLAQNRHQLRLHTTVQVQVLVLVLVRQSRTIPVNVPSGPNSRNDVTPSPRNVRTPSANRTASRTCRTQYSGSPTSAALSTRPDTFDTTPIRGARNSNPRATERNSSNIGSIRAE